MKSGAPSLLSPEHFGPQHDVSEFANSRHASLDAWLRNRARTAKGLTARTYVVCPNNAPKSLVANHCVLAAIEERSALPSAKLRKGTPDRVPLLLIGRLAVDHRWQGRGVGSAMLIDAIGRCVAASDQIGARAIVAHALDDEAQAFYGRHGFVISPLGERVMVLPMETARGLLLEAPR